MVRWHHQPVMIFMEVTGGSFGMAGIHWDHEKFGCPFWDESPAGLTGLGCGHDFFGDWFKGISGIGDSHLGKL